MESFAINQEIVMWLNRLVQSRTYLAAETKFVAVVGGWLIFVILIFYLYRHRRDPRSGNVVVSSLLCALIALAVANLIKNWFPIPRPFEAIQGVIPLFQPGDASFPSGHSAFFGALSLSFWRQERKWGYLALVLALFVVLARVAAGVHYPLDVAAGLGLAFVFSLLARVFSGSH